MSEAVDLSLQLLKINRSDRALKDRFINSH